MGPVQFLSGLIEENGLPYLMSKFSKLCLWIPSLLQVKVRPVIESLNGNLLTTPTGEENKGEGCIPLLTALRSSIPFMTGISYSEMMASYRPDSI